MKEEIPFLSLKNLKGQEPFDDRMKTHISKDYFLYVDVLKNDTLLYTCGKCGAEVLNCSRNEMAHFIALIKACRNHCAEHHQDMMHEIFAELC